MFLPPDRGKNRGCKNFFLKVKLLVHTLPTSHHTSNLDHFWARYQRFLICVHIARACNVVLLRSLYILRDLIKTHCTPVQCAHILKNVDIALKNGPNLMYDGLLEAYGQVVWLSKKNFLHPLFLPLSGGKNTQKWPHFRVKMPKKLIVCPKMVQIWCMMAC